jgi:hypothetical protein
MNWTLLLIGGAVGAVLAFFRRGGSIGKGSGGGAA